MKLQNTFFEEHNKPRKKAAMKLKNMFVAAIIIQTIVWFVGLCLIVAGIGVACHFIAKFW